MLFRVRSPLEARIKTHQIWPHITETSLWHLMYTKCIMGCWQRLVLLLFFTSPPPLTPPPVPLCHCGLLDCGATCCLSVCLCRCFLWCRRHHHHRHHRRHCPAVCVVCVLVCPLCPEPTATASRTPTTLTTSTSCNSRPLPANNSEQVRGGQRRYRVVDSLHGTSSIENGYSGGNASIHVNKCVVWMAIVEVMPASA